MEEIGFPCILTGEETAFERHYPPYRNFFMPKTKKKHGTPLGTIMTRPNGKVLFDSYL